MAGVESRPEISLSSIEIPDVHPGPEPKLPVSSSIYMQGVKMVSKPTEDGNSIQVPNFSDPEAAKSLVEAVEKHRWFGKVLRNPKRKLFYQVGATSVVSLLVMAAALETGLMAGWRPGYELTGYYKKAKKILKSEGNK
jgi:hypothetical protein